MVSLLHLKVNNESSVFDSHPGVLAGKIGLACNPVHFLQIPQRDKV